jgi:hypothetical protein
MSQKTEESPTPRFEVGDKVRDSYGVIDLNFPDFPLGGCSGIVTEIVTQEGHNYCVFKLDDRTQTLSRYGAAPYERADPTPL